MLISISRELISFVNLFIILPIGILSKNSHYGALSNDDIISLCILDADFKLELTTETALA